MTGRTPRRAHPARRLLATTGLLAAAAACSLSLGGGTERSAPEPADLVFRNARLHDPVDGATGATSIAVRRGRIVALGRTPDTDPFVSPRTRVIDVGGGALVPGLQDAHGHLLGLGAELDQADLRGARSLDELARRVAAFAKRNPDGWVRGRGWDQNLWPGGAFPTRAAIDPVVGDRPALLTRVDGHALLASSAALRLAGVDASTQAPSGGRIERDAAGEPTGVLVDAAMGLVSRVVPPPSDDDRERWILAAQSEALAAGLTAVHDAGESRADQALLRRLDAEGRLELRVYGMASVGHVPGAPEKGRRYELRAVKAYADGALGSRGAALLAPYADDPGNVGLMLTEPEALADLARTCAARGLQLCVHAIGDRGNRAVLDAFDAALPEGERAARRFRVEHCQVVAPEDFARFARGGYVASMQPIHATSDGPWAGKRVGAARMEGAYAWRRFLDLGVPLAFGSDFPVELHDPRLGLFAAVTRRAPDDPDGPDFGPSPPLSAHEALAGFTSGAAFASFREGDLGGLRVGYLADFTVFATDPFVSADPKDFLGARVLWTVIEGKVLVEPGSEAPR